MKKIKHLFNPEMKVFQPGDCFWSFNAYSSDSPVIRKGFCTAFRAYKEKDDKKVVIHYYGHYRGDGTGYSIDHEHMFSTREAAIQGYRKFLEKDQKTKLTDEQFEKRFKAELEWRKEYSRI